MTLTLLRYAWLVGLRDFQYVWTWRSWLFGWTLRVTAGATTWVLVSRLLDSQHATQYLLVGQIFAIGASGTFWALSAAAFDRLDGTFEHLAISPVAYLYLLLGRTGVWYVSGLGSALLAALILTLAFGRPVPPSQQLHLLLALATACLSAFTFAMAHGALLARWPRARNLFLGLLSTEVVLLSGAVVPVDYWPPFLAFASFVLPVTHSLQGVRSQLESPGSAFWPHVGAELAVALLWLLVACFITQKIIDGMRRRGFE